MFNKVKELKDSSYIQFKCNTAYSLRRIDGEIRFIELDSNDYSIKWVFSKVVSEFVMLEQHAILSSLNPEYTEIIDLRSKETVWNSELSLPLGGFNLRKTGYSVFIKSKSTIYEINTQTLNTTTHVIDKYLNLKELSESILVFAPKREPKLSAFDKNINLLWEIDITEIASYTDYDGHHAGEIDQVYVCGDRLIVLARIYVLAFELASGKLIWKTKFDYRLIGMAIHGDEGYILAGQHYASVDLLTGEITLDIELDDFDFHGHKLQFNGYGRLYHAGLIWCCLQTSGYHFVAALYPETGKIVWMEHVNTSHSLSSPQFHENNMYVLDAGGTLYIYEKTGI